jgi:nondiscriminating glutamyl-tRNA synthetase
MVLGPDRQKLSKRNGDTSVYEYLDQGYLPEALLNFLVLLGWWPATGTKPKSGHPEILTREELISLFELKGLQKAPAIFDVQKLNWMNSFYMRMLPVDEIARRARPFFEKSGFNFGSHPESWFQNVVGTVRAEAHLLNQLPDASAVFFQATPALEADAKAALAEPLAKSVVDTLVNELRQGAEDISSTDVEALQKKVAATTGAKGKSLFMPMRAVMTGKTHGPELKQILPLLGRETVMKRIEALRKQAGV